MNKRMFTFAIILLSFPIVFSAGNMTEFILPSCPEVWSCSEWAECDNGVQLRSCIDEDNCGTENFKPQMIRNCTEQAIMPSDAPEQVQQQVSAGQLEENASTNGMLLYAGLAAGIIIAGILLFFAYKKWSEKRMISKMFEPEKQSKQPTASNLEQQQPVQMQQQQDYPSQEKFQQPAQVSAQSQANQQQPPDKIQAYIQQCISAGYTKDQIKAALLQAGWAQEAVDSALSKY